MRAFSNLKAAVKTKSFKDLKNTWARFQLKAETSKP